MKKRFCAISILLAWHIASFGQIDKVKVSTSKSKGDTGISNSPFQVKDIIGTWRLDMPQKGDVNLTSYFIIKEDSGNIFDGIIIINNAVDLKFAKARIEGNEAVFSTDWNRDYRMRAEGDKLHVTLAYSKEPWESGLAYKVTLAETRPPKFIELPSKSSLPANGLAKTPPMGWNSWNHFQNKVSDSIVRIAADRLVSSGLAALGYKYVNIDDCWEGHRDAAGNLVPNTAKA
jgi:alpha-galactosidase